MLTESRGSPPQPPIPHPPAFPRPCFSSLRALCNWTRPPPAHPPPTCISLALPFDPGARCAFGAGPRPPIAPPTHISPALLLTPASVVHVDVFAPSLEQIVDPWPRLGMCFLCVAAESLCLYGGVFSVGGVNILYRFLWRSNLASCFENILLLSTRARKNDSTGPRAQGLRNPRQNSVLGV